MIWCGSLITHIDEQAALDLLTFFCRHLADGGVCVFTTLGAKVADEMADSKRQHSDFTEEGVRKAVREYQETGYGYTNYAWADEQSPASHGVSLTSPPHMLDMARSVGPWEPIYYLERGWHEHQDVYGFMLPGTRTSPMTPSTLGFLQPDGERRVRTSRNLYLLLLALCCSVVCFAYAVILTPYVMPNYYDKQLPFSQRLKSTSFGDSGGYGSYADGFLRQRAFQNPDGQPAIKHMPGLPLILAAFIALFGTVDAFRAAEILFFFVTLYCFLILLKAQSSGTGDSPPQFS